MDKNISKLVGILNKYPGITTSASCGGHTNPTECQMPENEWYVVFDAWGSDEFAELPSLDGWKSLGKISHATYEYLSVAEKGKIELHLCNLCDRESDPEGINNEFELHGYDADLPIIYNILKTHLPTRRNDYV